MIAGRRPDFLDLDLDPGARAERCRVIAEGAGATSVAAALTGKAGAGKVVCVVSGGNIDAGKLAEILRR